MEAQIVVLRSEFEAEESEALKVIGSKEHGMSGSTRTRPRWPRAEEVMCM